MGYVDDRERGLQEATAKWDYLTLSDFKCTSGWTVTAYIWLWFMVFVGIAVYVLDTYTAVNLLAFNQWSSQVKPALDFKYSKWIFAVCILLSWALCIYELIRAWRVISKGGVAQSFLDPTAVTLQSIRPGGGWKRFLVFTELTKSKKGVDYVALFVYFAFKGAIRVILAESPRQCVNAMTLYAVLQADLLPTQNANRSAFDQFWYNVQVLADQNLKQAMTYISMLVTLCIWVFSALSLIIATILYLTFLWHYIPQKDGRLRAYCKRKVDKRLATIIEHKVKAALEDEERNNQKAIRKAEIKRQKTGELPPSDHKAKSLPTLPNIDSTAASEKQEKRSDFAFRRQNTAATNATLPAYSSQPPTPNGIISRQPTLPDIASSDRPGMVRSATQSSDSYGIPSDATDMPLLANAGYAGSIGAGQLPPPAVMTRFESQSSINPFHGRTRAQAAHASQTPFVSSSRGGLRSPGFTPSIEHARPSTRQPSIPRMPLPVRSNTASGIAPLSRVAASPTPFQDVNNAPLHVPVRCHTADGYGARTQQRREFLTPTHVSNQQYSGKQWHDSQTSSYRPFVPRAPASEHHCASPDSYELQERPSQGLSTFPRGNTYTAFNPAVHTTKPSNGLEDGPRINPPVSGAQDATDYFNSQRREVLQRSFSPGHPRYSNYAHDILDEYGAYGDEVSR